MRNLCSGAPAARIGLLWRSSGILAGWIGERVGMRQAAERITLWIAVFECEADFEGGLIDDHAVVNPPA